MTNRITTDWEWHNVFYWYMHTHRHAYTQSGPRIRPLNWHTGKNRSTFVVQCNWVSFTMSSDQLTNEFSGILWWKIIFNICFCSEFIRLISWWKMRATKLTTKYMITWRWVRSNAAWIPIRWTVKSNLDWMNESRHFTNGVPLNTNWSKRQYDGSSSSNRNH